MTTNIIMQTEKPIDTIYYLWYAERFNHLTMLVSPLILWTFEVMIGLRELAQPTIIYFIIINVAFELLFSFVFSIHLFC